MFWMALEPARKQRVVTLYDTPRLPRRVWDQFRARTAASGEAWIDVLRRLMEGHGKEGTTENQRN